MPQVYAIIHNGAGDFMIARKPLSGYFFHNAGGGGTIIPAGQPLNGGGGMAFPGGGLGNQPAVAGAIREFNEETNVLLAAVQAGPPVLAGAGFRGVYFNLGVNFNATAVTVQNNITAGNQAAQAVIAGTYGVGQYNAMRAAFAGCPSDNELYHSVTWNLRANIQNINALNAPGTDWYFLILLNLALQTYGVVVVGANGLIVGIGTAVNQLPGPQYSIIGFTDDVNAPVQQGVNYTIRRNNGANINHVTFVNMNAGVAIFQ